MQSEAPNPSGPKCHQLPKMIVELEHSDPQRMGALLKAKVLFQLTGEWLLHIQTSPVLKLHLFLNFLYYP